MIKNILDHLLISEAYGISEEIEIAKGKYATPRNFKEAWKKIIREVKFIRK